jgi:hypothetical protein
MKRPDAFPALLEWAFAHLHLLLFEGGDCCYHRLSRVWLHSARFENYDLGQFYILIKSPWLIVSCLMERNCVSTIVGVLQCLFWYMFLHLHNLMLSRSTVHKRQFAAAVLAHHRLFFVNRLCLGSTEEGCYSLHNASICINDVAFL